MKRLFTFSLLLFTSLVARAEFDSSRLGVCSWTWHTSMTNVLAQMEQDGRYTGMQLALAPWLGIDNTGTYFGDQEGPDVWALIKGKISDGKLNVMSTMINFPKEDYSTLSSITNTQGYMYGVAESWDDADEQWASNLFYTAEAAKLTKELGVQYLTTEAGFICIDQELMFNRMKEVCATCGVYGVTLLIESGPQHSQFMTNLLTRLNNAGVDNVGVNFDPGDTELFDAEDPVESYRAMKPWIRQIHVKDCMRFGLGGRYAWNEDCAWGEGIVSRLDFGGCHTFLNVVKNDSELNDVNILYERITTDPALMAAREREVKLAMDRIILQMNAADGTPGNPWSVGAEPDTVLAYLDGEKVVFSGHGSMRDFIGSAAPWGTGITAAEFGPQVGTIGANAFAGCNLTELTMRGNPPALGEGNDFTSAQVSVRGDAFEKFMGAEGWKNLNIRATVPVPYDWQQKKVKKLAPFLHEIWFTDKYESPTDEAYTAVPDVMPGFSCTSVRNGRYYGRNMDYYLSDVSTFIVHMPAKDDPDPKKRRLASIGVASQNAVREDGVTNGLYTASYDTLPEIMYDGINECGVIINNNVVPRYDCGTLTGTNPEGEPLHVIYLIRYVLDHATNALHAVELIKSRDLVGMAGPEFQLHWLVADPDPNNTYVVEVINSKVVARKMDINSNFNWNWDNKNKCAVDDDYAAAHGWGRADYPVPYDTNVTVEAIGNYYTPNADGVERFCIMREYYDEGGTFEGMFNLLQRVQYTKLGDKNLRPLWFADLTGGVIPLADIYGLYKTNEIELLEALNPWFATNRYVFAHKEEFRKENSGEWQTVHNTTYDFKQQAFRIAVQEDYEHTFDVFLVDRQGTKDDPWLVGKEGLDSVRAYVDGGTLIVEGHGTMRDFCETAPAPWGTGVSEVHFGPQVMGIGANAFRGCEIVQLEMRGNPPALGAGNDFSSAEIGVRADALAKFGAADGWRALGSRIQSRPVAYEWEKVRTLAPFLHEVWYEDGYESPLDLGPYTKLPDVLPAFSCTAVRNGNYLGRNLDYFLDDVPAFIVHMPAKYAPDPTFNRLASVGATQHPALHEDGVTGGRYTASYELIPEMMYDGINECGVVVEQNVVPRGDCGEFTRTESRGDELSVIYVTRYVLDHATNALHGVELVKGRKIVDVKESAFMLHWMIADPQETYVVEIVTNTVIARKMDIMSNFNLNWDNEKKCAIDDDYAAAHEGWGCADYPVPYDTNNVSLALIDKYYTPHAEGVERFICMRDHYGEGDTLEGMFNLLRRVQYTKLGDPENRPMWLSDFSASYSSITDFYGLYRTNVVELMARLDPMFAWSQEVFAHKEHYRTQNTHEWQTVYNATYDIEKRMFRIAAQEDYDRTFDIFLVQQQPEGSELNPWAVGPDGHKYDVAAWTNGTGGLVLEGAGPVATMPWRGDEEIFDLVKDRDVEGIQSIVGSLPALEYVNGLTREEFTAAALGFVKADSFSTINVENGKAKLDVVVSRSDALGESADWKPVSTNEVTVPAPGEQGFFIVAPQGK